MRTYKHAIPPRTGPSGTFTGIFGTWVACTATCLVLCWLLVPAVIVLQSLRGSAPLGSDHFIGLAQPVPLLREPQILPVYSHLQGVGPASQLSKRHQKLLRLKRPAASQQQGTSACAHSSAHLAGHTQNKEEEEQQQLQEVGPVDVVCLLVNGSDPQLLQELQDLERGTTASSSIRQSGSQNDAVRQARFDAGRDELRYSIRSLELYLPWYRHLYIVTNGQVGTGSAVGWARVACGAAICMHAQPLQSACPWSSAPLLLKGCILFFTLRAQFQTVQSTKATAIKSPFFARVPGYNAQCGAALTFKIQQNPVLQL